MTVGDLLFQASVMAGLADPRDGQLAPEDSRYAWDRLQDLIDDMKTERLFMFRRQRVGPFTVSAGQGDITAASPITIGSGGTWNTPRPTWIDAAGVIYTAGGTPRPELKMTVLLMRDWQDVMVKGITSTLSRALIYDQQYTSAGLGHIYLYPVPSESFQVVLYVPIAVDEFPLDANLNPDFSTVIALPPGYRPFLISNLAKVLCLGIFPVSADLREEAARTKTNVLSSNVVQTMDPLRCDPAVRPQDGHGGAWDWISGGFT